MTERRADEATRDVVSWLKCEFLRDQVGEVFPGIVSAVTGFGLFVELKELFVEGLIHVTALPHDYYRFEAAQHRLVGERTRKVFGLADELMVRVVRVDLDNRKIDFELETVVASRAKIGKSKPTEKATKRGKAAPAKPAKGKTSEGRPAATKAKAGQKKSATGKAGAKSTPVDVAPTKTRRTRADSTAGETDGNQDKKTRRTTKAESVPAAKAGASAKGKSIFSAAAAGIKKALAKRKKEK